jgi:hypothetical protein
MMKIQLPLFILLFFTAFGHAQECDEVTINLTATPATTPTSFDGSIEVELSGNGVVETYYWNNGYRAVPSFWEHKTINTSVSVQMLRPLDIDGFGGEEILIYGDGQFQIAYKSGGEWYTTSPIDGAIAPGNVSLTPKDAVSFDLNGDGAKDLILSFRDNFGSSQLVKVYHGIPDSQFEFLLSEQPGLNDLPSEGYCFELELADLEGDGDLDVFCAIGWLNNSNPSSSAILVNDEGVLEVLTNLLPNASNCSPIDVDDDGDMDIWFKAQTNQTNPPPNNSSNYYDGLWLNNSGFFTPDWGIAGQSLIGSEYKIVDVNEDGRNDILCGRDGDDTDILINLGNGQLQFETIDILNCCDFVGGEEKIALDIDYDGDFDLWGFDAPGSIFSTYNDQLFINEFGDELNFTVGCNVSINSQLEEANEYCHGFQIRRGNLLERNTVHSPVCGGDNSPYSVFMFKQQANIGQTGLPPGEYELCLNTTDGCEYCNSVTVTSESGYDCTDSEACNYNPNATEDDGSCEYGSYPYDCDGNCLNDADENGICDEFEQAAPYNPDSNGDGIINLLDLLEIFPLFGQPIETVPCINPE